MQKLRTISKLSALLFSLLIVFNACNDKDDENREEQEAIKLQQYLIDNGYSDLQPTSSGLYHVVLSEGDGESPGLSDYINILFTTTLVDGTVVITNIEDIAIAHNIYQPNYMYGPTRMFMSNLGILGLREGIMLMKEGGKSRLIIPSNLALGSDNWVTIPSYSTLIYDVELFDVISDPEEHEQKLLDAYIEDNEITAIPSNSGLYYIETELGTGTLPGNSSIITVHFKGSLLDGRVFVETKFEGSSPVIYNLSYHELFPGFLEGIKKMRKNGKARLIIPWDIAFGAAGTEDGTIPPYSTVIFDVEMVDIQ